MTVEVQRGSTVVTFRCKQSGNTVSFKDEIDIASMRKEEGYEEVKEEKAVPVKEETVIIKPVVKRGRPRK